MLYIFVLKYASGNKINVPLAVLETARYNIMCTHIRYNHFSTNPIQIFRGRLKWKRRIKYLWNSKQFALLIEIVPAVNKSRFRFRELATFNCPQKVGNANIAFYFAMIQNIVVDLKTLQF